MPKINADQIWSGDLNRIAIAPTPTPRVGLYDTTLRDGEQAVGVVFSAAEKLELARLLDEMGVDRIEAGFAQVSEEDRRAIEMILKAGLRAEIWGFSRALIEDVDAVLKLGCRFTVIEAPISDAKLAALGLSREKVQKRIADAVSHAARQGLHVAFFGVDGSRADLEFLETAYKTAIDSGAREAVVVDTIGIAAPESAAFLVSRVARCLGSGVPIHFHGHNDFGLATASAIAAVRAGASWIHATLDGIGERAGNANLAQVALALDAIYGAETNLRLECVRSASERLRAIARYHMEPWKPVVGDNLFVRETGAVAAQFHIPAAIEPYSAEIVATPRAIVLGKKSGLASIRIKCRELGLDVPEDRYGALLTSVKDLAGRKKGLVSDAEFRQLAGSGHIG